MRSGANERGLSRASERSEPSSSLLAYSHRHIKAGNLWPSDKLKETKHGATTRGDTNISAKTFIVCSPERWTGLLCLKARQVEGFRSSLPRAKEGVRQIRKVERRI